MELVILGSGSAFSAGVRGQAGYLVRHGQTSVIVDVGPGTVDRLVRAGHRPERVEAIFLTHWHPDHISDLVPFLFNTKHAAHARTRDLHVHGPTGFTAIFDGLMSIFGQWCVGELYDVVPVELERSRVPLGELSVTAFPVRHGMPAVGYRIEADGHVIALTGDTGPYEGLVELARGADILVADATWPDGTGGDNHLTAREAGKLAAAGGVRTLVLSHLSPEADAGDAVGSARAVFEGQVVKAADLLPIAL